MTAHRPTPAEVLLWGKRQPMPQSAPLIRRLCTRIDRRGPDECWPWLGWRNVDGYGRIDVLPHRNIGATRALWEIVHGSLRPGWFVLHTCDNPACMNMRHLRAGTNATNQRDRASKGRAGHFRRQPLAQPPNGCQPEPEKET